MWLKRSTDQNIVIGGAAGAVPVLVGWAAVTGSLAMPAIVLFAVVFVWTPPHFWALALRMRDDYAAAGVPMLPVVRGEDETRRQIFLYSLVLFATTLVLVPIASMGPVYIATAVVLGGAFVYRCLQLWRDAHRRPLLARVQVLDALPGRAVRRGGARRARLIREHLVEQPRQLRRASSAPGPDRRSGSSRRRRRRRCPAGRSSRTTAANCPDGSRDARVGHVIRPDPLAGGGGLIHVVDPEEPHTPVRVAFRDLHERRAAPAARRAPRRPGVDDEHVARGSPVELIDLPCRSSPCSTRQRLGHRPDAGSLGRLRPRVHADQRRATRRGSAGNVGSAPTHATEHRAPDASRP